METEFAIEGHKNPFRLFLTFSLTGLKNNFEYLLFFVLTL